MPENTLSVVQLCPDVYRDTANAVAKWYGYGPDNLSRALIHADGSIWWGCHAWLAPSALTAIAPPEAIPGAADALAAVVVSVREGGEPLEHWQQVLAARGLTELR